MQRYLPNILTLTRIILIPIFAITYYLPWQYAHFTAGMIFFIASATDFLDGYLARRLQLVTRMGAFLDPVADKLLVATALVLVVAKIPWVAIPAAIIIGREITISALREWMAEIGKRASVAVGTIGKIKTGLQMVSLVLLIMNPAGQYTAFLYLGIIGIIIAAILTLWSMVLYLATAWKELRKTP